MSYPQNQLSTYAKVTIQGILNRLKLPVTLEGAEALASNNAISHLVQPILLMVDSMRILTYTQEREENCQNQLLGYVNNDTPKEEEERGAEVARGLLHNDKEELVELSNKLSNAEMITVGYFEGIMTNPTVSARVTPMREDLKACENMLNQLQTELDVTSGGKVKLLGESLAGKMVGALHNDNKKALAAKLLKDLNITGELSPGKTALIVALLGDTPEQAKDMKDLVGKVLRSKAVNEIDQALQPAQAYQDTAEFGIELDSAARADVIANHSNVVRLSKDFTSLQIDKIEPHVKMWAVARRNNTPLQSKPLPRTEEVVDAAKVEQAAQQNQSAPAA